MTIPSTPPAAKGVTETLPISVQDPIMILAGIRQFGLASDGSDLRDLEAAIEALSTPAAGGLAVKALRWEGPDICDELYSVGNIGDQYVIRAKVGNGFWLSNVGGYFPSVDDAKAAAQADFNARILSALDRTTLPTAEGEKP